MKNIYRFVLEFGPLAVFFILFKIYDLKAATIGIVITTAFTALTIYLEDKKLSFTMIFTSSIVIIFGLLSLYSGNYNFIKMKPTILYSSFAIVLFGGVYFKVGLMKFLFGKVIQVDERSWVRFSFRWAVFFLLVAIANEYVWRSFNDATWVNFKVFGILPLTAIFTLSQVPFMLKNKVEDTSISS